MTLPPVSRVGYPDAMRLVLNELSKGMPMSISGLSRKLNIDRRTISKVIDMLLEVQTVLTEKQIETERIGRRFIVRFQERTTRAREILSSARVVFRRRSSRKKK